MKVEIIKETDEYIVVNKPAGMKVHADNLNRENNTLIDWLLKGYKDIKDIRDIQDIKGSKVRPGIVHRSIGCLRGIKILKILKILGILKAVKSDPVLSIV